jgi:hypothetical protein
MSEALQTSGMNQMLRRCTKSTLQMIADIVNPVPGLDPSSYLPAEPGVLAARDVKETIESTNGGKADDKVN